MGVRHHRDLKAWKSANHVRRLIIELTSRDRVRRDFKFCEQACDAAGSACRNIAEGFWRYGHKEFAYFVNLSRGSLGEIIDLCDEALQKGHIDEAEHARLDALATEALESCSGLHTHLSTTPTPKRRPPSRRPRASGPDRKQAGPSAPE